MYKLTHPVTPHLWFDAQAKEAADFYTALFPDSVVVHVTTLHDTPSGDADVVSFTLAGQPFMAISAGPYFTINPSLSFHYRSNSVEEINMLWTTLKEGGKVLMELGEYPFSKHYGWLEDKYGVSWQLFFSEDGAITQRIVPMMMFTGTVCGKAEEAARFYATVFADSEVHTVMRYGAGEDPDTEGTAKYVDFSLAGMTFTAMDSAYPHGFSFNEGVSLVVSCATQDEIDYYWEKLSAVPEAEQCGWLKDVYGVSWQIVPETMNTMMRDGTPEQIARVTRAFLPMKKFDISILEKAYHGA